MTLNIKAASYQAERYRDRLRDSIPVSAVIQEIDVISPDIGYSVITFTANRTINAILQNGAAQAKCQNIHFRAQVNLPEVLNIPETDLCALLMNMLDNALEAASKVSPPEDRNIFIQIKVADLYLAIHCENSFNGEIRTDKNGELLTTKENPAIHGYGIRQMKEIAKKYQSVIRFDQKGDHTFIVQTALRIPDIS